MLHYYFTHQDSHPIFFILFLLLIIAAYKSKRLYLFLIERFLSLLGLLITRFLSFTAFITPLILSHFIIITLNLRFLIILFSIL